MSAATEPTKAARAGAAVAIATLVMAAASGVQAIAYLSSFGTSARTDAFFAAFALYTVFGVFCQSIRVTSVPLLVGERRLMRGRDYAATLALIAVPVALACGPLAALSADLLAPGLPPELHETTETALQILGGAMVLQLAAAGEATLLGVWDRFDVVAGGYIAGALAGVATYFAAVGPAGELALGWSMLAMAVVTAAWLTAGLQLARTERTSGRVARAARLVRNAGLLLGRTIVYFVLNGLFLVTLAFASRADAGDATVLSYAYLFASYLVAGTSVAVGISRVPDMTRGAQSDWDEVVADTVPHGFRYAIVVVAPALAGLVAAGALLIGELLPGSFAPEDVEALRLFAALLAPWLVAALLVNYMLPALFALGRARVVNLLAIPLVALQLGLTAAVEEPLGVEGVVAALSATTLAFGLILVAVGGGARRGEILAAVGRDSVLFLGLAAAAYGAGAMIGGLLADGLAHALIAATLGSLAYLALLRVAAPRQVEVLVGALRRGGPARPGPAEPGPGAAAGPAPGAAAGPDTPAGAPPDPLRVLVLATYFPKPGNRLMGVWALAQAQALRAAGADVLVVSPTSWVPRRLARVPGLGRLRSWAECPADWSWGDLPARYPRWAWYAHTGRGGRRARPDPEPRLRIGWLSCRGALRRVVASHRPDVVFAHHSAISGYLAMQLKATTGVPYVVIEHDHGELRDAARYPRRRALYERVIGASGGVVAVGSPMRRAVLELCPETPVTVANNGAERFDQAVLDAPRPPELDGRAVVFSAAHLYFRKAMPLLVEAFARIASRHPHAVLRIAGDGEDRPAVERAVAASGVADRIALLGRTPNERVRQEMAWADVFALIGWDEPFAIAFAEAMAAATPIVCCDDGGIADVVEDGVHGLLVPPRDVDAAAAALDRLLSDPGARRRMGAAAQRLAAERLSWEANADVVLGLLEAAAGRAPSEPALTAAAQGR